MWFAPPVVEIGGNVGKPPGGNPGGPNHSRGDTHEASTACGLPPVRGSGGTEEGPWKIDLRGTNHSRGGAEANAELRARGGQERIRGNRTPWGPALQRGRTPWGEGFSEHVGGHPGRGTTTEASGRTAMRWTFECQVARFVTGWGRTDEHRPFPREAERLPLRGRREDGYLGRDQIFGFRLGRGGVDFPSYTRGSVTCFG